VLKCRGLLTTPKGIRTRATTRALKELGAKVTNGCPERTGDEGGAIREAHAVVERQAEDG
jgi:hypothetical protein